MRWDDFLTENPTFFLSLWATDVFDHSQTKISADMKRPPPTHF